MLFQYNSSLAFLGLTAFVAVTVAIASWRRRTASSASIPFTLMMLAIAGYAAVAALEAVSTNLADKIFWSKWEYVGSGSVMTLFLIFALHFTHKTQWLTRRHLLLLLVPPAVNAGLAATNEYHHLIWTGFLASTTQANQVIYQHGLGFYWVMGCGYLYTAVSSLLLLQSARHPTRLQRQQSMMTLLGAVMPLLGGSAYMLKLTPPGLNITPMSFLLTGVVYFVTLFRFRLFDLVPIARDTLIESMTDGVLVLDLHHRIVDFNPVARFLSGNPSLSLGQSIAHLFAEQPEILRLCQSQQAQQIEVQMPGIAPRYVAFHLTPLRDRCHAITGRLLVLRDVTQQYQTERNLRQLNERLQAQLSQNRELQTQLREQAIRDELTGLFNRRYFDETLLRELARATRDSYPVAIILMDIDFFKRINDTYGHQGGDRFLQEFAHLLRSHSRQGDIACRYGGEEFVLTLPGMSMQAAYQRAEQIRRALQELRVEYRHTTISTTVSLGISLFPYNGLSSELLLWVADQALYLAKADGRNCIRWPGLVHPKALLPILDS